MKISEITQCKVGQELQKAKAAEDAPTEFNRLLAEEAAKTEGTTGETNRGTPLAALASVTPFHLGPVLNDFSDDYRKAELAVEGTINRMEKLQSALQDSTGSLKQVQAAVTELVAGAEDLQQSVVALPENHQLRQMADELTVLAHVESVKYRRGDYL
jgi:hypothetical protein